jgi:hypothetical protein
MNNMPDELNRLKKDETLKRAEGELKKENTVVRVTATLVQVVEAHVLSLHIFLPPHIFLRSVILTSQPSGNLSLDNAMGIQAAFMN